MDAAGPHAWFLFVMHAAFFIVLLTPAAPTVVGIVHADVAVLREKPAADARAVAKLRINTKVGVESERGEWLRVNAWSQHDGVRGVEGWLLAAEVGRGDLSKDYLLKRASDATDPAERTGWLEKAAAIDGTDASTWRALLAEYESTGSPKKASIEALLHDRGSAYVAACVEGRVVLLGERRANGSWRKWTGAYALEFEDAEHELALTRARAKLKSKLQGSAWFATLGSQAIAIPGTPFLAPKLDGDGEDGGHVARLVLGRCPWVRASELSLRPALMWTVPMAGVEAKPALRPDALPKWTKRAISGVHVFAIGAPALFYERRVIGEHAPERELLDGRGRPLAEREELEPVNEWNIERSTSWVRPLFGERGAVYGIRAVDTRPGLQIGEDDFDYDAGGSHYGFHIETVLGSQLSDRIEVVLWQVGC